MTQPPRKKHRTVSTNTITQKHPLNVKPGGNALLFSNNELTKRKHDSMGYFSVLSDDLILDILGFIDDPIDLMNLSHASKVLYAFSYDEELWRKLYMRLANQEEKKGVDAEYPLGVKKWLGSWRKSMLGLEKEADVKLEDGLLCSDLLFRPFQCSNVDYYELFKGLINEEQISYEREKTVNEKYGIERIRELELTEELFGKEYYLKPFILTNSNNSRWPTNWSVDYLEKRFSEVKFRQESVKWKLNFYKQYHDSNKDESPLYLFDCQSTAIKQLSQEYEIPNIFKFDFFKLFQQQTIETRPDYKWIIVGPKNSGSTFHKDPNSTSAWNANLTGLKLWIMTQPGVKPPGIDTDETESEVTSPVGITEWVLSGFYNDSLKLAQQGKCLIGITFPGEVMYVPSGWWHSVINLDDSVALTQNFVPRGNLPNVLYFLKNKREQISGFHIDEFVKSLRNWLAEKESSLNGENAEEDLVIFHEFLKKIGELESNEEDIGELKLDVELPIYELLLELIKSDPKYASYLNSALEELAQKELKESHKEPSIVPSKKWEKLTTEASESPFSFNFEEESDEE